MLKNLTTPSRIKVIIRILSVTLTLDSVIEAYGSVAGMLRDLLYLNSTKLDYLCFIRSDNRPQIDILSINESHLKPSTPDSLFDVPGFDMHRRDRKGSMKKGGVLVYVNKELKHRRRTDLEDSGIEIIWLEVYPYKSNRPLLFAGVYRRAAY